EGVGILGAGSDSNVVEGNFIGTDRTGTAALGNIQRGVNLFNGAQHNIVGTDADGINDDAERNIISGNGQDGVGISTAGTSFNVIAGNYVGTDSTGSLAIGNHQRGVSIFGGAAANTVGGTSPAARNVIGGNLFEGVGILGAGSDSNVVEGNFIGTDRTG